MQALWMVLAAFFFASMGVCVKLAAPHFTAFEMVFWRGLISMAMLWWLARRQGIALKTRYPGMHAWRSFIGVTALAASFYAIIWLPLPTAMTFGYMSSVWIAAFIVGGAMLSWRPSGAQPRPPVPLTLVACVLLGFVGVVMMLRPTVDGNQGFAAVVGLLGGMCAALAYMQVVALSRLGEPETRTVFYFALGCSVAGLGAMAFTGVSAFAGWPALWLLPLGLFAAGGQLCMTMAFSRASSSRGTLLVANLQYSGLIFASIYSMLVFGEYLPLIAWLGMALIVLSAIAAGVLRTRSATTTQKSP
ncbi:DMT family transporter [Comamonas sp. NLF-1-9]|uniref:DMT family transporter n=1 Tax=Comamonas sp. NLF-1-9 TaxID=2853163 RepID=UPI001C4788B9|nr:DMT family transporter [Comamonas sp. NLF-1-9]QXL84673.1 DMT family transporter [Comamonas sp. NLF-1-9]